jgi:hypothetical protein
VSKQPLYRYIAIGVLGMVAAVSLPACSLFRGKNAVETTGSAAEGTAVKEQRVSGESQEELLQQEVEEHVARAARIDSPEKAPIVKHHPYFLKEYSLYPAGISDMEVRIRETESRVAPKVANVTLEKQRYATKMHRKKNIAREDSNFYRESGKETLTYEWRNDRWVQVASLFVVDVKEERVGGEWQAVEPEVKEEAILPEEDEGFFKRVFGGIFGR